MSSVQVGLANHLWQSTVFLLAVGVLTLLFRKNSAAVRYRLWLIASVKFLIPFSLLVGLGSHYGHLEPPTAHRSSGSEVRIAIGRIGQPFDPSPAEVSAPTVPAASVTRSAVPAVIVSVWLTGATFVLLVWVIRWLKMFRIVRHAKPFGFSRIQILLSPEGFEPGVFGIIRPVLLLPEGIDHQLQGAQLESIIAHEMVHVRGRHNLAAAVHTLVEALFWFHPLVWWLGSRLVEERERVCDEAVLQLGWEAADYAEGILKVCKCYLAAPACVAGVSGSNLTNRIEAIMDYQGTRKLNLAKKLLVAVVALGVVGCPLYFGMMRSSAVHASPLLVISAKAAAVATPPELVVAQAAPPPAVPVQQAPAPPPKQASSPLENWPDEVAPVMSDAERAEFLRLQKEAEREKFIENFWLKRDPSPGTSENEFRDEYYRRVTYANDHFTTSEISGLKSDRGKMYILYGPPDEIDATHPTGGSYRATVGGRAVGVFPFETWRYRHIDGKGDDLTYEFVDMTATGDYRLELDPGARGVLLGNGDRTDN